jgi:leucyl-tRNA synthetase
MGVPCGDQRDFDFARHFGIPITNIIGTAFDGEKANPTKEAVLGHSGFLNGLTMRDAIGVAAGRIEAMGIGKRKVHYKMRDAGFSRQRYWGEPFPIIWSEGMAIALDESELPLELPYVGKYGPGKDGQGPLSNLTDWVHTPQGQRETSTMPGYAGSSWYFLRYMDPHNQEAFAGRPAIDYWNQVDVYVGGTEHAVGHLLYSRMWTKFLYDLGLIGFDEPFKKLVNQGMIQGSSRFVYRVELIGLSCTSNAPVFISKSHYDHLQSGQLTLPSVLEYINELIPGFCNIPDITPKTNVMASPIHVDVSLVDGVELHIEEFKKWKPEYAHAAFVLEDSKYICGSEVEKMSKSKYNTVNPNDLVSKYGADTFRMYEMFLGPLEQSKPWDTKGIEGVHRFLKKLWRLFFPDEKGGIRTDERASDAEWKILHKTLKKIGEDTERFSFNTAVSAFMVCVNELSDLKCHKKEILQPLLIALTPYAPHIAEELYHQLGNSDTILNADFPVWDSTYLLEAEKEYPVSINGRLRTTITISLEATQKEVEEIVLRNDVVQKWMEGRPAKKIIFVKNKMVNVVV